MYYKKVPDGVAGMLGDGAMYRVTKGTRVSDPIISLLFRVLSGKACIIVMPCCLAPN